MTTTTKKSQLLRLLGKQWVTPLVALREVGIMSLSQRVSGWRAEGYVFAQKTVECNGSRVAAYRLVKGAE